MTGIFRKTTVHSGSVVREQEPCVVIMEQLCPENNEVVPKRSTATNVMGYESPSNRIIKAKYSRHFFLNK